MPEFHGHETFVPCWHRNTCKRPWPVVFVGIYMVACGPWKVAIHRGAAFVDHTSACVPICTRCGRSTRRCCSGSCLFLRGGLLFGGLLGGRRWRWTRGRGSGGRRWTRGRGGGSLFARGGLGLGCPCLLGHWRCWWILLGAPFWSSSWWHDGSRTPSPAQQWVLRGWTALPPPVCPSLLWRGD